MNRSGLAGGSEPSERGAMASKTTSRFSPEAHARAVRLVFEHTALAPTFALGWRNG